MLACLKSTTQTAAASGSSFATYPPSVTSTAGKLALGTGSWTQPLKALRAGASFQRQPAQLHWHHPSLSSTIAHLHTAGVSHSLGSSFDSLHTDDGKTEAGSKRLPRTANEDSTSMPFTAGFGAFVVVISVGTP